MVRSEKGFRFHPSFEEQTRGTCRPRCGRVTPPYIAHPSPSLFYSLVSVGSVGRSAPTRTGGDSKNISMHPASAATANFAANAVATRFAFTGLTRHTTCRLIRNEIRPITFRRMSTTFPTATAAAADASAPRAVAPIVQYVVLRRDLGEEGCTTHRNFFLSRGHPPGVVCGCCRSTRRSPHHRSSVLLLSRSRFAYPRGSSGNDSSDQSEEDFLHPTTQTQPPKTRHLSNEDDRQHACACKPSLTSNKADDVLFLFLYLFFAQSIFHRIYTLVSL